MVNAWVVNEHCETHCMHAAWKHVESKVTVFGISVKTTLPKVAVRAASERTEPRIEVVTRLALKNSRLVRMMRNAIIWMIWSAQWRFQEFMEVNGARQSFLHR